MADKKNKLNEAIVSNTSMEKSIEDGTVLKKLIGLFRTNTVIRHHFQAGGLAKPQGTAKVFFKNSYSFQSPMGAGYGNYDRFARYCLSGDTLIVTNTKEGFIRLDDLVEKFDNGEEFQVFSYDKETNSTKCAKIESAHFTKEDFIWEVKLDDECVIRCTGDHPFMMRDGSYKMAKDLKEDDALMPCSKEAIERKDSFLVLSVTKTDQIEKVYDLTIPQYHNFAVGGIDRHGNAKSLIFLHNSDYSEMESSPILSNALNIFADEVTQKNEDGKIIQVTSEKSEIKNLVQELFDNVLHLGSKQLWKLTRNLLKYGDAFYLLDITENNGVVNMIQMPANEIEREEGFDKDEPNAVRFRWTARQNIEIPNAYVAHFRLDGNDLFHPYGQCLKYDTKILTTDGIKEIKDVKKDDNIVSFDTQRQVKVPSKVIDVICSGRKECIRIGTRHNFVDASKEHKILVLQNGEFVYKQVSEIKIGDNFIISKDHKTENIIKIDKTRPEENKNGWWNSVDCIPDQMTPEFSEFIGFMFGDGWVHNDNTVCFAYGEENYLNEKYSKLLEKFSQKQPREINRHNSDSVGTVCVGSKMLSVVLARLGFEGNVYEKRVPEWVFSANREVRESFLNGFYEADGSIFVDKWGCARYQIELANKGLVQDLKTLVQSLGYKSGKVSNRLRSEEKIINGKQTRSKQSYYFYYFKSLNEQVQKHDLKTRKSNDYFIEPVISLESVGEHDVYDIHVDNDNHNFYANGIVVHNSVLEAARRPFRQLTLLEDAMMVYRISRAPERRIFYLDVQSLPPEDIENVVNEFNKTLKKNKVIDPTTGKIDLRYGATMASDEDYVIPVRGDKTGTRIDTLPGGQNLGDIEDIMFIRANLFAALGIPKAFLTFDEDIKSKQILTQEDIRFARTVSRVQEVLISELVKIAMIHLYVKGFRGRDLINFKIAMTNPSTVAELQKLELWRARMDLIMSSKEGVFDTLFIYKNFLKLSDEAIDKIKKGQIQDKIFQSKLLQIETAQGFNQGAPPGGLGGMGGGVPGLGMGAPALGAGAPPVDLGGAPPNITGAPETPGLPTGGGIAGESKNLFRSSDGNSRTKAKRGLEGTDLTMAGDTDDDPNDIAGIRRTVTSPMGGREALVSGEEHDLIEQVKKFQDLLKGYGTIQESVSNFPLGMSEDLLKNTFGEDYGVDKNTKSMLKEAYINHNKLIYTAFNAEDKWEGDLERIEENFDKLMKEMNSDDK